MFKWLFIWFLLAIASIYSVKAQSEWIVKLSSPAASLSLEPQRQDTLSHYFHVEAIYPPFGLWLLKEKTSNSFDYLKTLAEQENGPVDFFTTNKPIQNLHRTLPNDPLLPSQWAVDVMELGTAWSIVQEASALIDTPVIAIIDGGMWLTHPDLNVFVNRNEIPQNGIDDDLNGYIDDVNGWNAYGDTSWIENDAHGTLVAGVAAAIANNDEGIAGVGYNVKVLPICGSSGTEATVLKAYGYVHAMRKRYLETNGLEGANIVVANSSFGLNNQFPKDYPLWCAFYDSLGALGVLSVSAVANSAVDVDSFGDIPTLCLSDYLITVSSSNQQNQPSFNAAFGAESVDVHAPGVQIRSTLPFGLYDFASGTSYAAPQVSGVVALMHMALCDSIRQEFQSQPHLQALWIKNMLLENVTKHLDFFGLSRSEGIVNAGFATKAAQSCGLSTSLVERASNAKEKISFFPNPAREYLMVQGLIHTGTIEFLDITGKKVLENRIEPNVPVRVNSLSHGCYIVRIITPLGLNLSTFIKH